MAWKKMLITGAATALLGVTAATLSIAPVAAQSAYPSASEQILVLPSGPVLRELRGPMMGGLQTEEVSFSLPVGYDDLDLSRASDRAELVSRIHATARDVCDRLDSRFPPQIYAPISDENCVVVTTDRAIAHAERITGTRL